MNTLLEAHKPYADLVNRQTVIKAELEAAEAAADDACQAATEAGTAADAAEVDAITAGKAAPANITKAAKAAAQVAADAEDRLRILRAAAAVIAGKVDAAQTEAKVIIGKAATAEHERAAVELVKALRQARDAAERERAARAKAQGAGVLLPAFTVQGVTDCDDRQGVFWAWRYAFEGRGYTWPAEGAR